ncbi:MAG: DNA polymerase III subunit gamma and tau, partial [Nocardioides sp.]
ARILARALNCDRAPVADPCGECDSCRDLARGGPGSLDVIEIDAASHGGVDDARDLREKAFFAPVRSPYKVYIIDEAHMVTTQGFNALLKLVEEPPPHLRFIFATTEPEKVIATIRSRTHHYPFRLIPPRLLASYLSDIGEREGVKIEPAALPLIVRAGAGSARDSLSVLDQLLGGAGPEGVTHDLATGLLGYTPISLLDDVVDAFAAGDGASVFGVVDRVIETGQDPRRFTEDLLRRLRDLVIVAAVPDAPASGLIDVSQDQGDRLVAQAARFGPAELSRAADLVATGLTEMRGATAPRLLLELVCARVLLPGADPSESGLLARVDRLEKRASIAGGPPSPAPVREDPAPAPAQHPVTAVIETAPEPPRAPAPVPAVEAAEPPSADPEPAPTAAPQPEPEPVPTPAPVPQPVAAPSGASLTLIEVRRLWPDVVEATKLRRRVAWMHLTQNSQVIGVEGNVLTLGFSNVGARDSFLGGGCDEVLRQAAIDVAGIDWRIEAIVAPGTTGGVPVPPPTTASSTVATDPARSTTDAPPGWAESEPPVEPPAATRPPADAESGAHHDDPDADSDELEGAALLERELGAQVIEEISHP